MVEENIQLNEEEEVVLPLLRVPARHIGGEPIKKLDFSLIADLVQRNKAYKSYIDVNLDIQMRYCMWRSKMYLSGDPYYQFLRRVKPLVYYRRCRSWRWQSLPPEERPKNEIPLTVEAGKDIYTKLLLSDRKLAYLQKQYFEAVKKAYAHGYSVRVMARAIGVNESNLRKEILKNMEWYRLAEIRHQTAKYIWE